MIPYVLEQLKEDMVRFGFCAWSVIDDYNEFSIRRMTQYV